MINLNISFDEKQYTTLDNGELDNLNNNQNLIQEMLTNFGDYKIKKAFTTVDTEYKHRKNLNIFTKDQNGKISLFVFDIYGIKYIKLNNRKVSSNVVNSKKEYLNLTADFLTKMIQVNDENYKNLILAKYKNIINFELLKIRKFEKTQIQSNIQNNEIQKEIEKSQKVIDRIKYVTKKIDESISNIESERQ